MQGYKNVKLLSAFFFLLFLPLSVPADTINIKVGSLAPKGTSATICFDMVDDIFRSLEKPFGTRLKIVGYYGGTMGDDPQMIQKAKLGQLDILTPTVNGLPNCVKEFETLYLPYIMDNFGEFDYFVTHNASYINELFYNNGWVTLFLLLSEGQHDIYLGKACRTPEELKKNINAANYTGAPDDAFYRSMGIPQFPVQPTEMYPAFRTGVSNAAILPSVFVIGMQIYTSLPYVVEPSVRMSPSAVVITRKKWDAIPWEFKVFFAGMQPLLYSVFLGVLLDAAYTYSDAMVQHGSTLISLTPEERKTWMDAAAVRRDQYLTEDKTKRDIYNRIVQAKKEYNSRRNDIKDAFENDPKFKNFPDRLQKIIKACNAYIDTDSKEAILRLENDKILEKWRLYDWLTACEELIKKGSTAELEKWMRSYYTPAVINEIFSQHLDLIKILYGSKEALKERIKEYMLFVGTPRYKGFRTELLSKR